MKSLYEKPNITIKHYNISAEIMASTVVTDPVYDLETKDGVKYTLGTLNN